MSVAERVFIVTILWGGVLGSVLSGCTVDKAMQHGDDQSTSSITALVNPNVVKSLDNESFDNESLDNKSFNNESLDKTANDKTTVLLAPPASSDELKALQSQLASQQARLDQLNMAQQALQDKLKRLRLTLQVNPLANANAGVTKQGMASSASVAFLEDESQFTDIEARTAKEVALIPGRSAEVILNLPQEATYLAIKVGLRHTQKRSQFLLPLSSINFDSPLALTIGACDVQITAGIDPTLTPTFTSKLEYYQQPLVRCQ